MSHCNWFRPVLGRPKAALCAKRKNGRRQRRRLAMNYGRSGNLGLSVTEIDSYYLTWTRAPRRRDFPPRWSPVPLGNFSVAMSIAHLTVRLRDARARRVVKMFPRAAQLISSITNFLVSPCISSRPVCGSFAQCRAIRSFDSKRRNGAEAEWTVVLFSDDEIL